MSAPPATFADRGARARVLATVFSLDTLTALAILAYGNAAYLIDELDAPDAYPAFALAIYGLCKIAAAPAAGRVFDRAGPLATLYAGLSMVAGGLALMLLTHSAAGYIAGVGPVSAGLGFTWLVVFAAIGQRTTAEHRGSETGFIAIASIFAFAAGFGGAGLIAETGPWWLPFVAALALGGVALGASSQLAAPLRNRDTIPQPDTPAADSPRLPGLAATRASAVAVFLHFAVTTAVAAVFGAYVLRTLDLKLITAGLLLTPAAATGGLGMLLCGRISRPGRRLREIGALYVAGGAGALGLALARNEVAFALAAIPLGLAIGGALPILNAAVLDIATRAGQTGRALGWMFLAQGVGTVSGPAIAGAVIALTGTREALLVLGVAYLAGAGIDTANSRRTGI